jgi:hypothetical protein
MPREPELRPDLVFREEGASTSRTATSNQRRGVTVDTGAVFSVNGFIGRGSRQTYGTGSGSENTVRPSIIRCRASSARRNWSSRGPLGRRRGGDCRLPDSILGWANPWSPSLRRVLQRRCRRRSVEGLMRAGSRGLPGATKIARPAIVVLPTTSINSPKVLARPSLQGGRSTASHRRK